MLCTLVSRQKKSFQVTPDGGRSVRGTCRMTNTARQRVPVQTIKPTTQNRRPDGRPSNAAGDAVPADHMQMMTMCSLGSLLSAVTSHQSDDNSLPVDAVSATGGRGRLIGHAPRSPLISSASFNPRMLLNRQNEQESQLSVAGPEEGRYEWSEKVSEQSLRVYDPTNRHCSGKTSKP